MFKLNKTRHGFTLIELLVVISIISILSTIVLSSLNRGRAKSRDAFRISQIVQVQRALELYYNANNSYPNISSLNDDDVPAKWQQMMAVLDSADYLKVDFSLNLPVETEFSFIETVYAIHYYPSTVQDPLYTSSGGADWEAILNSYAYSTINSGSGYVLRIKLEDANHPILRTSNTSVSIHSGFGSTGTCDSTQGYYCISNR